MRLNRKVLISALLLLTIVMPFALHSYIEAGAVDKVSSIPSSSNTSSAASSSTSSVPSSAPPSSVPPSSAPSSSNKTPVSSSPVVNYSNSSATKSSNYVPPVSSQVVESSSSEPEESEMSLPEVSEDDISLPYVLASAGPSAENNKLLGIIAWSCIGLGVLIVLIVLFSGRRAKKGYVARKRYKSSFGLGKKKKRLLSDSYYRNIKRK